MILEKRVVTILELNWNQRLGHREDKIEHLSSYAHIVYTTAKQVISRRSVGNASKVNQHCHESGFQSNLLILSRFDSLL